jgi:hypothetical protein
LFRQSFGKIITLVIAISLLFGGLAPANPGCTAKCCVEPKIDGLHSKFKAPPADLVADCCSGLETAPCPRKLESSSESKDYAPSAVAPTVSPATVKISASSNNKFILPQSRFLLAARKSPQIRGPGVPIYLRTETFLI